MVDNNNTEGVRRVLEGEDADMNHPLEQDAKQEGETEEERELREVEEEREKNKSPEISTRGTRTRPSHVVDDSAASKKGGNAINMAIIREKGEQLSPSKVSPVATKRGAGSSRR